MNDNVGFRVAGLDLGKANDYTALAIFRVWDRPGDGIIYDCGHLERFNLGTSYTDIVRMVKERLILVGGAALVVDKTGVGDPVCDLLEAAGLRPLAVTITSGTKVHAEGRNYWTPKRDIVSAMKVVTGAKRLRVADLLLRPILETELQTFDVRIDARTAHDSYGAWREGAHDDLLLAVALVVWLCEHAAAQPWTGEEIIYRPVQIGPAW